jgi:hypothetical protein
MGDAAGELSESLHALGANQPVLRLLPPANFRFERSGALGHARFQEAFGVFLLRDVAQDHGEHGIAADVDPADRRLGGKLLAVAAQRINRLAFAHVACVWPASAEPFDVTGMPSVKLGRDQSAQRLAENFGARVTENAFGAVVEHRDALLAVDADDRVGGERNDRAEAPLRPFDGFLQRLHGAGLAAKMRAAPSRPGPALCIVAVQRALIQRSETRRRRSAR